jgi:hypothetical protein
VQRDSSHGGQQYPIADGFDQEITKLYEDREKEREARRLQSCLSPQRGPIAALRAVLFDLLHVPVELAARGDRHAVRYA